MSEKVSSSPEIVEDFKSVSYTQVPSKTTVFSPLFKEKGNKYVVAHQPFFCKDYLFDVLYAALAQRFGAKVDMTHSIYGFKTRKDAHKFIADDGRFYFRVQYNVSVYPGGCSYNYAVPAKNITRSHKLLKVIEQRLLVTVPTTFEKLGTNEYIIGMSPYWYQRPYLQSIFFAWVRLLPYYAKGAYPSLKTFLKAASEERVLYDPSLELGDQTVRVYPNAYTCISGKAMYQLMCDVLEGKIHEQDWFRHKTLNPTAHNAGAKSFSNELYGKDRRSIYHDGNYTIKTGRYARGNDVKYRKAFTSFYGISTDVFAPMPHAIDDPKITPRQFLIAKGKAEKAAAQTSS